MTTQTVEPPEEFVKIVPDFISDILNTFPEYEGIINKWWKVKSFDDIENEEERNTELLKDKQNRIKFVFKHCLSVYPERFFEILYQNDEMFSEESSSNTDFLPGISFKYLWQLDISEKTRETIWKYLQLISISVIGCVHSKEAFGNTAKLFENIDEEDFKGKLEETLEKMQGLFENGINFEGERECEEGEQGSTGGINMENMPSADDIHSHINNMMSGKIGNLAKEIAEETANDLNIDLEGTTDVKGVFQNLFKNPGKLMNMVKNVGDKLDSKIKSGDIKETELIAEASDLMNKMKNMPGMGDIQSMLAKMGMGMGLGSGAKPNMNAMKSKLQQNMKMAEMKERMKSKIDAKAQAQSQSQQQSQNGAGALTDEQLLSVFSTGEKVERTPVGAKPQSSESKSNKKKKGKNKNKK